MHRVVPDLIVEKYRAGRYGGEFPAVGMFLDLKGFSTMTDALMQHGQHGAEVLAGLMHGVFDPLVESIFDYGGKIVGFAGDGIMALFPVESDAKSTALRALASAFMLQERLKANPTRQTVYGEFPISAKIGLSNGPVSWGILHSPAGERATYYFRGVAVDDSAHAEHFASSGDILLTDGMQELLQEQILTEPYVSLHRFKGFRVELPSATRVILPPVDRDISRRFMPDEVIVYDVHGEFRQIVNLFIRFPDLSDQALQELMIVIFDLQKKYGGLLSRLDFGDKGCNLLMLWGAPVAYENDIGRALNLVLDLKSNVDFPITAGVTYYIAHAGYLGSSMFEDYTCYGWGVNLASRFMMGAPSGQIWVDDRVTRRVSKRFEIEFIGSQIFKGFAAEQKVHVLRGYKQTAEAIYQGELVGRDEELARLASFAEPLWQNEFAGLVCLSGDAGIGKSRLIHEFRFSEIFEKHRVLWAVCQSNQILRQSFNPLRAWLLRYFEIASSQSMDERRLAFDSKLDDVLASIPDPELAQELDRTRSFLASLLDIYWPESLFDQLDAEGRYNNTILALIALLKAESLRRPVILFLEDLQFTDSDTIDFLPRLKRALVAAPEPYPLALIVTSRPHGNSLDRELVDLQIDLHGLTLPALTQLIETSLGGAVDPELAALVMDRSEGNPYFAEQIIRYLQEESMIEMSAAGWTPVRRAREVVLPGDIRAVLVARIDQLTREVREIIQTASVLGREFEIQVLVLMLHEDENIYEYVGEAEKAAIWAPLNELRYIFTHGLLRDAAYTMQMRARRRELHSLVVDALEKLYADDFRFHSAELAYHAERAGLNQKALHYYTIAGKTSADVYQNSQAIEYWTRALAFTPSDDLKTQYDLLAERVELFNRLGNRPAQLKDLETLEALAGQLGESQFTASALMLRGSYHFVMGDYLNAIDCAKRAETVSPDMANIELQLYNQLVWALALLRLGRLDESMQRAQATLEQARGIGNRKEETRVLTSMGLIALEQKEPAHAQKHLVEALEIAREIKDLGLQARALNNLAVSEGSVNGDYSRARIYYEEAYKITRQIGDRHAESVALGNLGFVAGMQGDFVTARSYHEQSLILTRETGNRSQEIITLINLSAIAAIQNESESALAYAQLGAELAQRISERSGEGWAMLYMGHAYSLQNRLEMARSAYHRSLEIRNELGQPSLSMEPIAGLIETYLRAGDIESAARESEKIMAFLESGSTLDGTEEPLRVYYACYRLLEKKQDPRSKQILQMAINLLETQVSKFGDDAARARYVENIPWRRAIWDLAGNKNYAQ